MSKAPVRFAAAKMRTRFKTRSVSNGRLSIATVESSDRLASIGIGANTAEGTVLFAQNLNPRSFTGTNLELEACLWDQYRLKEITFTFSPLVGTQTDGAIVAAFDPDIADETSYGVGTTVGLTKFCAHETAAQCSLYRAQSWRYRPVKGPFLFARPTASAGASVTSDQYWTSPGIFALVTDNAFASAIPAAGTIWYDAVYEFMGRNVEASVGEFSCVDCVNNGTSGAATPFVGAVISAHAGCGDAQTIDDPVAVTTGILEWSGLDPNRSYLIRGYFFGGSGCSTAPVPTVQNTFGTLVDYFNSFGSTAAQCITQVVPSARGIVRISYNQGTWVAYPTTSTHLLVALPVTADTLN